MRVVNLIAGVACIGGAVVSAVLHEPFWFLANVVIAFLNFHFYRSASPQSDSTKEAT